jgi:signal recognition particle subunit SRP68
LISQTKENQITTFSEVSWRNGIKISIKNEKVKLFLLNLQEYEKQIQDTNDFDVKISVYESILKQLVDIVQIVRDELKMDQTFQSLQRGQPLQPDEKPSNLILLFSYLTWTRITQTIDRNLLMLELYKKGLNNEEKGTKNAKPQDMVRIYDIILQVIAALRSKRFEIINHL